MLNFKKIFISFMVFSILISSIVFASDTPVDSFVTTAAPAAMNSSESTAPTTSVAATTIDDDVYISNADSFVLTDIITGNVFASVRSKFSTNPRNNGGIIKNNLFLVASEATIESDVTYSDTIDKNGNYMIDVINAKSIINGNVYAFSDTFTIEAGSEIFGDLYLYANTLNVEPNAVIHGNLFTSATTINFSGHVEKSAYIASDTIKMTYASYIGQDLFLNTQNATLDGKIYRNAYITANNNIVTRSAFEVMQNISINYAENLTLSGRFSGGVLINAKNLNFKNDDEEKLLIQGDLNYATKTSDIQVPEGTVLGEITTSNFEARSSGKFDIAYWSIVFVAFLVFVLVIVFLCKKFTPKVLEITSALNVSNILKSLLVGFVSVFALVLLFVLLCFTGVGLIVALFLVIAYLFAAGLSLPILLNKISEKINLKVSSYVKLLLVVAIVFLIKQIPFIGSPIFTLLLLTGIGDILITVFKKK